MGKDITVERPAANRLGRPKKRRRHPECPSGHPIAGWNVLVKDGREYCLVCQLESQREYARRAKEKRVGKSPRTGIAHGSKMPLQALNLSLLREFGDRPKNRATPQDISDATGLELNSAYVILGRLHYFGFLRRSKFLDEGADGRAYFFTQYELSADGRVLVKALRSFENIIGDRIGERLKLRWKGPRAPGRIRGSQ